MSIFEYTAGSVLSQIELGGVTYLLKDADARSILDTLGNASLKDVSTSGVAEGENGLVTGAQVQSAIAGLTGVLHFKGKLDELPTDVSTYESGDVIIVGTKEYLFYDGAFTELGDEGAYVPKTRKIANIALDADISVASLQSALGLKALAYKDSASGTVEVTTGINGASYTPAGTVSTTLSTESSTVSSSGKFTPEGSVSGSVTPSGKVTLSVDNTNGVTLGGTVSAPTITVTPSTTTVKHISSVGTLPSYTAASYTAPSVSESTSNFATSGVTATVSGETLTLGTASTSAAVTSTGFKAGSFTDGTFSAGTLPSLDSGITVVTGIESATATAPTFTGNKYSATFAGNTNTISATFSGSEGDVSVSGSYTKATDVSSTFKGTADTITPTLTKSTKTVTVS
jgi:hypothetical protein